MSQAGYADAPEEDEAAMDNISIGESRPLFGTIRYEVVHRAICATHQPQASVHGWPA